MPRFKLITEEVDGKVRGAYVGPWVRGLFGFWLVKGDVPDGVFITEDAAEKYAREALRSPDCPMWTARPTPNGTAPEFCTHGNDPSCCEVCHPEKESEADREARET